MLSLTQLCHPLADSLIAALASVNIALTSLETFHLYFQLRHDQPILKHRLINLVIFERRVKAVNGDLHVALYG